MLRTNHLMRWSGCASSATLFALALLVSGCSGGLGLGSPSATPPPATPSATAPSDPSLKDKIASFFAGSSASSPQAVEGAGTPGEQQVFDCPLIDIRQGASTLTIGSPGDTGGTADTTNNGAMALKYQGTFVRAARECSLVNGQIVMRVGVEGRIVVGPAGGPGQVDVPLRIAVVEETVSGTKPIITKLIHIPVTVASATDNPTFTHIEEGLSFPMPKDLDSYIVYIGFDPLAMQTQEKPKPKPKPRTKPPATTG
jgi:hypothetical protein